MKNSVKAFTVLELLVTIAIILILAALIFPVFSGVKQRAKETVCLSNMKQIYAAAMLYRSDYGANPPNSLLLPAWKSYAPESLALGCPAAVGNPDRYTSGDYNLAFDADGFTDPGYRKCSDAREGEWPAITDRYHLFVRVARDAGRRVVVLIRENGSAKVVNGKRLDEFFRDKSAFPCPWLDDPFPNL